MKKIYESPEIKKMMFESTDSTNAVKLDVSSQISYNKNSLKDVLNDINSIKL